MTQVKPWRPTGLLTGTSENKYAVIVLNQPVNSSSFAVVANSAAFLVCADGGANWLMAYEKRLGTGSRVPDAIVGDLDSLSSDAEQYYRAKGTQIVKDPDQMKTTDEGKCLKWLRKQCCGDILDVVILGGLGGRVDQGFSQVHYLYLALGDPELLKGQIYLLSEQSLTFVLDHGRNDIHIEPDTLGESVGIIPVLGPTRISTRGLEWDVEDWPTEFGGQLSTSTHLRSDKVVIEVNGKQPLVTFELDVKLCMPR